MEKKGQEAFEFLAVYGWVFILMFVIWAGLSYFGIFNVFLPNECLFDSGIICKDFKVRNDEIIMNIKNVLGSDIIQISMGASECDTGSFSGLKNEEEKEFSLDCSIQEKYYRGQLDFNYTYLNGELQHTHKGIITSEVEN